MVNIFMIDGYEQRFVAFIDILGFKDLIQSIESKSDGDQDYKRVTAILNFMHDESMESNGHHDLVVYEKTSNGLLEKELGDPRINYISDCVIISTEGSFDGFKAICNKVTKLSVQGASVGIFVRGGITYGNVYHHGPMLFGTAYQRALMLEGEAKNPRVLIDDSIFEMLADKIGIFPLNESAIKKDLDGKSYLANYPWMYISGYVTDWLSFLLRVKSSIIYFLNKFDLRVAGLGDDLKRLGNYYCWRDMYTWQLDFDGGNQSILEKYIWLKDEFNSTISSYSEFLRDGNGESRIALIVWNDNMWAPKGDLGRFR